MKYYINRNFDEGFFFTVDNFDQNDPYQQNVIIPNSQSSWLEDMSGPVDLPEELIAEYEAAKVIVEDLENRIIAYFMEQHRIK